MVTVALNYGEIKSHSEIVLNVKPFINKYNCKRINYLSKIDDWKTYEKNNPTMLLIFCILKRKKYAQLIFQNITQPVKDKYFP